MASDYLSQGLRILLVQEQKKYSKHVTKCFDRERNPGGAKSKE